MDATKRAQLQARLDAMRQKREHGRSMRKCKEAYTRAVFTNTVTL